MVLELENSPMTGRIVGPSIHSNIAWNHAHGLLHETAVTMCKSVPLDVWSNAESYATHSLCHSKIRAYVCCLPSRSRTHQRHAVPVHSSWYYVFLYIHISTALCLLTLLNSSLIHSVGYFGLYVCNSLDQIVHNLWPCLLADALDLIQLLVGLLLGILLGLLVS